MIRKSLLTFVLCCVASMACASTLKLVPTTMSTGGGGGSVTVLQPTQVQYLGACKFPEGAVGVSSWGYGGDSLTFYPGGNGGAGSLFGSGHVYQKAISEVSLCTPQISANQIPSELNAVTTLQTFADITDGLNTADGQGNVSVHYVPANGSQSVGHIWFFGWVPYNVNGCDEPTHGFGWSGTNMASSTASGLWTLSNIASGFIGRSFVNVPASWADAADHSSTAGKYLMVWRNRQNGLCAGYGPSGWVVSPQTTDTPPANGSALANVNILYYGNTKNNAFYYAPSYGAQYYEGSKISDTYQADDMWLAGAWPENVGGTTALLFIGQKSDGFKAAVAEITALDMQTWYGNARSAFAISGKSGTLTGTATGATSGFVANIVNVTTNYAILEFQSEGGTFPMGFTNGETVNASGGGHFTITTPAAYSDCEYPHGFHTCKHHAEIVAYNPDDLASYVKGSLSKVTPAWTLDISSYLWHCPDGCELGGGGFDATNNKIYVTQKTAYYNGDPYPIVHVFKLNAP